jgi:hypothetical protein
VAAADELDDVVEAGGGAAEVVVAFELELVDEPEADDEVELEPAAEDDLHAPAGAGATVNTAVLARAPFESRTARSRDVPPGWSTVHEKLVAWTETCRDSIAAPLTSSPLRRSRKYGGVPPDHWMSVGSH